MKFYDFPCRGFCACLIGLIATRYFMCFEAVKWSLCGLSFIFSHCCLHGNPIDFEFHSCLTLISNNFSVDTFSFLYSQTYHLWIIGFVSCQSLYLLFLSLALLLWLGPPVLTFLSRIGERTSLSCCWSQRERLSLFDPECDVCCSIL